MHNKECQGDTIHKDKFSNINNLYVFMCISTLNLHCTGGFVHFVTSCIVQIQEIF